MLVSLRRTMKYRPSSSTTQSASEHTRAISCNTLARGLVLAGDCRAFKFRDNDLVAATSYTGLLCATRGYFNTRPCCNLIHENALSLSDGKYSFYDETMYDIERCERGACKEKITRQCLPTCKRKEKDPEHFCFEIAEKYDSYNQCVEEPVLPPDACTCYDAANVLYPAGKMRPPRRERAFTFPQALELSRVCGVLEPCREFSFEYCSCKHCGSAVELLVPTACGFITFERVLPLKRRGLEPDDVDGKFECYYRVCAQLCPEGSCSRSDCHDGRHHHEKCKKRCHTVLADVVCERKECQQKLPYNDKCVRPSRCHPCNHISCGAHRCDGHVHHHNLCSVIQCPERNLNMSHRKARPFPEPGSHTKRLGVLGFDKGIVAGRRPPELKCQSKSCQKGCEHGRRKPKHV
jgi:hypothetical protein